MPEIAHPETGDSIEVEVVDSESHHSYDAVQVEAVGGGIELADVSGESPWVPAEEVEEV